MAIKNKVSRAKQNPVLGNSFSDTKQAIKNIGFDVKLARAGLLYDIVNNHYANLLSTMSPININKVGGILSSDKIPVELMTFQILDELMYCNSKAQIYDYLADIVDNPKELLGELITYCSKFFPTGDIYSNIIKSQSEYEGYNIYDSDVKMQLALQIGADLSPEQRIGKLSLYNINGVNDYTLGEKGLGGLPTNFDIDELYGGFFDRFKNNIDAEKYNRALIKYPKLKSIIDLDFSVYRDFLDGNCILPDVRYKYDLEVNDTFVDRVNGFIEFFRNFVCSFYSARFVDSGQLCVGPNQKYFFYGNIDLSLMKLTIKMRDYLISNINSAFFSERLEVEVSKSADYVNIRDFSPYYMYKNMFSSLYNSMEKSTSYGLLSQMGLTNLVNDLQLKSCRDKIYKNVVSRAVNNTNTFIIKKPKSDFNSDSSHFIRVNAPQTIGTVTETIDLNVYIVDNIVYTNTTSLPLKSFGVNTEIQCIDIIQNLVSQLLLTDGCGISSISKNKSECDVVNMSENDNKINIVDSIYKRLSEFNETFMGDTHTERYNAQQILTNSLNLAQINFPEHITFETLTGLTRNSIDVVVPDNLCTFLNTTDMTDRVCRRIVLHFNIMNTGNIKTKLKKYLYDDKYKPNDAIVDTLVDKFIELVLSKQADDYSLKYFTKQLLDNNIGIMDTSYKSDILASSASYIKILDILKDLITNTLTRWIDVEENYKILGLIVNSKDIGLNQETIPDYLKNVISSNGGLYYIPYNNNKYYNCGILLDSTDITNNNKLTINRGYHNNLLSLGLFGQIYAMHGNYTTRKSVDELKYLFYPEGYKNYFHLLYNFRSRSNYTTLVDLFKKSGIVIDGSIDEYINKIPDCFVPLSELVKYEVSAVEGKNNIKYSYVPYTTVNFNQHCYSYLQSDGDALQDLIVDSKASYKSKINGFVSLDDTSDSNEHNTRTIGKSSFVDKLVSDFSIIHTFDSNGKSLTDNYSDNYLFNPQKYLNSIYTGYEYGISNNYNQSFSDLLEQLRGNQGVFKNVIEKTRVFHQTLLYKLVLFLDKWSLVTMLEEGEVKNLVIDSIYSNHDYNLFSYLLTNLLDRLSGDDNKSYKNKTKKVVFTVPSIDYLVLNTLKREF